MQHPRVKKTLSDAFFVMIYLYNPSTDLALACGRNNYTPPRNVAKFERDNALLPSLYASDGDYVLALNEIIQPLNSEIIPADIHIIYSKDLRNCRETIFPWGWNEALRIYLLRYGYPTDLLPTKKDVACWRELAHRRTAVKIAKLLGTEDTKMPIECFDMEGAEMVIRQKKKQCSNCHGVAVAGVS